MRSKDQLIGIAFPGLKLETWGTQSCAETDTWGTQSFAEAQPCAEEGTVGR